LTHTGKHELIDQERMELDTLKQLAIVEAVVPTPKKIIYLFMRKILFIRVSRQSAFTTQTSRPSLGGGEGDGETGRDLGRQGEELQWAYPNHTIYKDIGSGLNYKRPRFGAMVESICSGDIGEVVVAYRDRL